MFRRQRRPETLAPPTAVLFPDPPQHRAPKFPLVSTMRDPSCAAMLQTCGAFLPIALPQPLRLPVAQAHQPRRIHHPQLLAAHSGDRKSTRLNSSHANISYAVFCLKKKNSLSMFLYENYLTGCVVFVGISTFGES